MPIKASDQIAQQGQLSSDSFMNALKGLKDEQLRTTMGSKTTSGFAPVGVVAPRFDNPDKMADIQETKWITESADAVRKDVAERKFRQMVVPIAIVAYILFK